MKCQDSHLGVLQKRYSENFLKIHNKKFVLESLFNVPHIHSYMVSVAQSSFSFKGLNWISAKTFAESMQFWQDRQFRMPSTYKCIIPV